MADWSWELLTDDLPTEPVQALELLAGELAVRESMVFLDGPGFTGDPPGKLSGDRAGQHSIRINKQWRVCFRWTDAGPEDVEIVDYH